MKRPGPLPRRTPSSTRLLHTLEQLLQSPLSTPEEALTHAATRLGEVLGADKVDAFLSDPEGRQLTAVGTSVTPLGMKQRELGLHRLSVANGGRIVGAFLSGRSHLEGRVDLDREELKGVREALGIKSQIAVPIDLGGQRRGVLSVTSTHPRYFSADDRRFLELVATWLGALAHRAESVQQKNRASADDARRAAAEELIGIFAHDIGNYLFPLRTQLSQLRARAQSDRRTEDLRSALKAEHAVNQMSRMVSDLMDASRLERGLLQVTPQEVPLEPLVRDLASAFSLPDAPVIVRAERRVMAMADPERLRQMLGNLLGNAVRHSPAGAGVELRIGRDRSVPEKPMAVMEVHDQGPGVPPELLPHLFVKFSRGAGSSGLGLGLFLTRGLAESHGGSLSVESRGEGACFRLALPLVETPRGHPRRRKR